MDSLDNFYIWVYYASSFTKTADINNNTIKEITIQKINKYLNVVSENVIKDTLEGIMKKRVESYGTINLYLKCMHEIQINYSHVQTTIKLPEQLILKNYKVDHSVVERMVTNFNTLLKKSGNDKIIIHVCDVIIRLNYIYRNIKQETLNEKAFTDILENTTIDNGNIKKYMICMLYMIRATLNPIIRIINKTGTKLDWGILTEFISYGQFVDTNASVFHTLGLSGLFNTKYENIVEKASLAITYLNPLFLFLD